MPEQGNQTALVPVDGEYIISAKEFDAAGKATTISIALPDSTNFAEWSVKQQIVMLKRGMWSAQPLADIVWALAYAQQIGADPLKGDIFPTGQGRWGTSNKYKIRKAIETGNIEGIETRLTELEFPINLDKSPLKKDIECEVTIHVKGWKKPIVRRARLSRWYKANNPNWQGNPEHMLELNTVAHACEYVPGAVGATEDDERPPDIDATATEAVSTAKSDLIKLTR